MRQQSSAETLPRKSLIEFIPWANPRYGTPKHLAPLIEAFEAAVAGNAKQVVCAAPPRHGKTETMINAIVWALLKNPRLRFSYSTYGASLSRKISRKGLRIARRLGLEFESSKIDEWVTHEGGGCIFSGVDGPLTGSGVDIAIVDDPYKNRIEAESTLRRERVWDWFSDVLSTRIEGYAETGSTGNGSIFVFGTRWHPGDLVGELLKEKNPDGSVKWQHIHLPAINDNGEALWPERWPVETLQRRRERVGEHTWWSLFQGAPRARGRAVFEGVSTYRTLPSVTRLAGGLDLSYSAKTSSDSSVAVHMHAANHGTLEKPDWHYYVARVIIEQVRADAFRALVARMPNSKSVTYRWYTSTTEQGSGDLMKPDVRVNSVIAQGDKFIRAQDYAAAWNAGKVHILEGAAWAERFVKEHLDFTGVNDTSDDTVDAAVAAFDQVSVASDDRPVAVVSRRSGLAAAQM